MAKRMEIDRELIREILNLLEYGLEMEDFSHVEEAAEIIKEEILDEYQEIPDEDSED